MSAISSVARGVTDFVEEIGEEIGEAAQGLARAANVQVGFDPSDVIDTFVDAGKGVVAAFPTSLPLYGNHGGPGHGKPGDPVTDDMDRAFYEHDRAYGKRGYFDLRSDLELISNASNILVDPDSTWRERLGALGGIIVFTALSPVSMVVSGARGAWNTVKGWFD